MADTLIVNPEDNPESQEYIDSMAAKGEAAVNGGVQPEATPEIPPKPEGIPDKFYNSTTGEVDYKSLAKSYVELEKSKGKPAEESKDSPKGETDKTPEDSPAEDAANKAVSDAGLDMATLSKEYQDSGSLSEESYAKFAKAGIDKDTVDDYIEGQKARVQVMRNQAYQLTDGAEGYQAMIEYAKANLSPAEITAYNSAINSKDESTRDLALRGLWAKYSDDTGANGKTLITNKTNGKVGDGTYQSRAEMMADMNDPKYKSDPAFRAKVQTKLENSDIF